MAGEPRSINDLPDEIILEIFSYIDPEELCHTITKVCDRWNTLTENVALWKTLSYMCYESSDISRIVQVLTMARALHSLIIYQRDDVERIVGTVIENHVDIKKLVLEYCYLSEDSTGLLTKVVTFYPDLEALSLKLCGTGCCTDLWSPLPSAAYSVIARLKKLTELNLSHPEGLRGETVCLIVDSCQDLKKLRLQTVEHIGDDDVIHVIKKLGKQLTTLVLRGESLTDAAYLYLNKCDRLQELTVYGCTGMTDRGLLEGIGSLQELTSLYLMECSNLTAQALSTFLHRPSMTSMVLLNLSYCNSLDDKGLEGIALRCGQLKELLVDGCPNVTDAGISMVIRNCRQLRELNLRYLHYVTGHGWLPEVPVCLPQLRRLCLTKCGRECDEYIEAVVAAAPELQDLYPRFRMNRL